jgi:CheY-like chemotaxis protein
MDPLERRAPPSAEAGVSGDPPDNPYQTRAADTTHENRRTILVVENDEPSRRLIEQVLAFSGYASVSAANGQEALAALEQTPVDLMLMDLSMPVLDGYQTVALVRQLPRYVQTPIIAVSGHTSGEEREHALSCGCTDYLSKPFRPVELVRLVSHLLSLAPPGQSEPE